MEKPARGRPRKDASSVTPSRASQVSTPSSSQRSTSSRSQANGNGEQSEWKIIITLAPQEDPTPSQSTIIYEGYPSIHDTPPPVRDPTKEPVTQAIEPNARGVWCLLAGEVDRTKKRIQGFASVKPIKARVIPPNRLPPGEAPNWLKEGFISFEVINTATKRVAFGIKGDYELPVRNMAETNLNWHVDKDNEDEAGEKKANTLLLRIERGKLARVRFFLHESFIEMARSAGSGTPVRYEPVGLGARPKDHGKKNDAKSTKLQRQETGAKKETPKQVTPKEEAEEEEEEEEEEEAEEEEKTATKDAKKARKGSESASAAKAAPVQKKTTAPEQTPEAKRVEKRKATDEATPRKSGELKNSWLSPKKLKTGQPAAPKTDQSRRQTEEEEEEEEEQESEDPGEEEERAAKATDRKPTAPEKQAKAADEDDQDEEEEEDFEEILSQIPVLVTVNRLEDTREPPSADARPPSTKRKLSNSDKDQKTEKKKKRKMTPEEERAYAIQQRILGNDYFNDETDCYVSSSEEDEQVTERRARAAVRRAKAVGTPRKFSGTAKQKGKAAQEEEEEEEEEDEEEEESEAEPMDDAELQSDNELLVSGFDHMDAEANEGTAATAAKQRQAEKSDDEEEEEEEEGDDEEEEEENEAKVNEEEEKEEDDEDDQFDFMWVKDPKTREQELAERMREEAEQEERALERAREERRLARRQKALEERKAGREQLKTRQAKGRPSAGGSDGKRSSTQNDEEEDDEEDEGTKNKAKKETKEKEDDEEEEDEEGESEEEEEEDEEDEGVKQKAKKESTRARKEKEDEVEEEEEEQEDEDEEEEEEEEEDGKDKDFSEQEEQRDAMDEEAEEDPVKLSDEDEEIVRKATKKAESPFKVPSSKSSVVDLTGDDDEDFEMSPIKRSATRSSNLREFFGVKERSPKPVKRRRGRPRKKRDDDDDFHLIDDDELGSDDEDEDEEEPVVMKRNDSLLDDSQIEEPMTSFFLNQDRYDASQGEDSPAPAPPPRRGRQLTAMERKAEIAKQMMQNGMNLNQAVSAVLAADKEGVDGKGAAEPPEGDDDVFQSEEAMVYAGYKPQIPIFCTHPANIVEAATLASAQPPEPTYKPKLPPACTENGEKSLLSTLQYETVVMVGQRHEKMLLNQTRAGYFCGDGTGVGKGRQIAAIIADNFLKGRRKSVWFSASNGLAKDARRDLDDVGCGKNDKYYIPLYTMPLDITQTIPADSEGVLFVTYSMLVSKTTRKKKNYSRFNQLVKWCGPDFEGCIVFDEGHFAKNLKVGKSQGSSQAALKVSELQDTLSLARVVYVSATGATEPKHMAYMTRLGLWGPGTAFADFRDFHKRIDEAGVAAMEMVAMEMKALGMYCSRHLSYEGTTFDVIEHSLTVKEKAMYNAAARFWQDLVTDFLNAHADAGPVKGKRTNAKALLWGAHQRFFLQMCLAVKVQDCVKLVKEALDNDCAVVIGLFSTGESVMDHQAGDEVDDIDSAPSLLLKRLLEERFPTTNNLTGKAMPNWVAKRKHYLKRLEEMDLPANPLDDLIDRLGGTDEVAEMTGRSKRLVRVGDRFVIERRESKVDNIEERNLFMDAKKDIAIVSEAASIGISLQADKSCKNQKQRVHIVLQLPWAADKAVQQLGRTHRSHQRTAPFYKLLITDLGGERRLASTIAGRLASLGALTSADRRAGAASRTLSVYLLQPKYAREAISRLATAMYDAERKLAIAQTHGRPEYAGPSAAAGTAVLGTNPTGFQPATTATGRRNGRPPIPGTSQFNITPPTAPRQPGQSAPAPTQEAQQQQQDKQTCRLAEIKPKAESLSLVEVTGTNDKVKNFLNRLLGLEVEDQILIFQLFTNYYEMEVNEAIKSGTFDDGVFDLQGQLVKKTVVYMDPNINMRKNEEKDTGTSTATAEEEEQQHRRKQQFTELFVIEVDRGLKWDDALRSYQDTIASARDPRQSDSGFYTNDRSGNIVLAVQKGTTAFFHISRPHLGHQRTAIPRSDLRTNYTKVTNMRRAEKMWIEKYSSTNDVGLGNRLLRKNILVGSVLPTFKVLQEELEKGVAKKKDARIQIVRAIVHAKPSTAKGKEREDVDAAAPQHKIVGILIPPGKEHNVIRSLQQHEIQRHLENRKQRLIRGLAKLTQREQWRFVGDVEEIADPLCMRYFAGDDLINAAAAKKKRSGPSTAITTERITLRAVLQQLKEYDKSRMARENELIEALKTGAPAAIKADPAKLDAHVAALRALCPRTFINFVNGTANTSAKQTAYSMLVTQIEEERKKKRTTEVATLGRELAPQYTTFDLLSYLTAANPLVINYIENRLAISVAHNTPYPLEWYSVIPNTAQEIIDKIVALKCAHQRKQARQKMFLDLLAQKAADLTQQFAFLVTPDDIKEADPQTLIHFNNTPTADPADTVNALGRHLETQTALLAWLQKQLQANGPLPLATLEQYFMRDYRLPFSRYYTRGLMTFIVTHSRSLTLRQGRVYWLPSR